MSMLEVLQKAPDLAQTLLDGVDVLVLVLDHRGYTSLINRAVTDATGYTIEQVRHAPFWELFCPSDETLDASAVFSQLRSGGAPVAREGHWQTLDRRLLFVRSTMRPLLDSEGMISRVVCTGVDLTDLHQTGLETQRRCVELENQIREQDEQFRAKDEFLAMVSHELRTPLVTGLGYIDLLVSGHLGEVTQSITDRMKVARRSLNRLSSLVDDILAYQRATQKSFGGALQLESLDLAELCQECVGELLVRHEDLARRFRMEVPQGLVLVRADPASLRRVITNLLENAVRHAGDDAVIRLVVDRAPGSRVAVTVCDNGVGMDDSTAARIFEPFVQVGANRSGSGLGLAIVRGILQAHGTEPLLQSAAGEGTRVSFLLRLSNVTTALPRCHTPVAVPIIKMHAHARILLVDDDQDTLEFLQLALESSGYEVSTAPTAELALERVTQGVPDLFILDLNLPGQDGIRLCRHLKSEALTAHVPIYMFTGRADEPTRRRAESAGADGYIVKPVDARSLVRTIQLALGEMEAH